MSYTVLARKYRSRTFDDLVGQSAVATTLKNAVTSGRVHHGYLFTGTRGVGKTSTARILAKALNCSAGDGPTPTPCCECDSCESIAEGEDIDVIEIDAASNTGVDNIRDLRSNAAYRPSRSRFKVYIIDEVHMLSTGAFNALLKTLEEPPDHVKFILATTEIQKVPATIVSRCQRFDFKSIGVNDIVEHLRVILKDETIEVEDAVLRRVARLANGSMRDALSLLDQLLSFGEKSLTVQTLEDVLPPVHDELITELVERMCEEDAAGALQCVERSIGSGQTTDRFCDLLLTHLRTLMLINVCGDDTELVDVATSSRDRLVDQAGRFDAASFVYMIGVIEEVRRAVRSSSASRALLDAAVVRLSMSSQFSDLRKLIEHLEENEEPAAASATRSTQSGPVPVRTDAATPKSRTMPRTATSSAAQSRPATAKAPAAGRHSERGTSGKRSSSVAPKSSAADEALARSNPAVRQAMELFDARLIGVERTEHVNQSQKTGSTDEIEPVDTDS